MEMVEELLKSNFSIIPMKAEVKEPAVYWKYYQRKRATIREIERWRNQFGETNYAIVCGLVSDLGVIDVDDLKQIPTLLMMLPDLFNTCYVRTKRGYHFYFSLNGNKVKSTSRLFGLKKVELKAEGRYVMSPGSVIEGIEYTFERPFSCILPIPKIIIDLHQETYRETVKTKGAKIPTYRGKAKCIGQILNYDIPEPGREMAYFIAYSKLLEAGNTSEYAKKLIKLSNERLSEPLEEKEIDDKFNDKVIYPYGCLRINKELSFIDCSGCQVRGGLKVESLAMKNFHKLKGLTNSQRAILLILDTYFKGLVGDELPTIGEIRKYSDTYIDYYTVKNALKALKEKGII